MADHHRVTAQGQAMGKNAARLVILGDRRLAAVGLKNAGIPKVRDDMCASCAGRAGTVPNGCLQTQLDFLKCVVEGQPFYCHSPRDGRFCHGWIAARAEHAARPLPPEVVDLVGRWQFSPPDEPVAEALQPAGQLRRDPERKPDRDEGGTPRSDRHGCQDEHDQGDDEKGCSEHGSSPDEPQHQRV